MHNHKTVHFFQLNVYIEFEYIFYPEDSDEEEERGKFLFNFYFGYYSRLAIFLLKMQNLMTAI